MSPLKLAATVIIMFNNTLPMTVDSLTQHLQLLIFSLFFIFFVVFVFFRFAALFDVSTLCPLAHSSSISCRGDLSLHVGTVTKIAAAMYKVSVPWNESWVKSGATIPGTFCLNS